VRYCFKKDPNVTMLIEDAEQAVAREESRERARGPVQSKIREMLDIRLAGHHTAIVWPAKSQDIPDEDPRFLVAYLPLEFVAETKSEQERQAKDYLTKYGDRPRRFRNGLGLAIPDKKQIEVLRRAVRYLLAIERVEAKKQQHRLTKDQLDQLKERKRTEQSTAEGCFRNLYTAVWLPRVQNGEMEIEKIEVRRPLLATGIHERVMELLTSDSKKYIFGSVHPTKIKQRVRLGEASVDGGASVMGAKTSEALESFFRDIAPPRLESEAVLRKAIARGVAEGAFAYATVENPVLGMDGKYQINRDRVFLGRSIAEDEIDFDTGFLMIPAAVPEAVEAEFTTATRSETDSGAQPSVHEDTQNKGDLEGIAPTIDGDERVGLKKRVVLTFEASRDQVFKAFPAVANLADKSDGARVRIRIEGSSDEGFDPSWLRNAVDEPLDEADIERTIE
jgi:hypothetical protein